MVFIDQNYYLTFLISLGAEDGSHRLSGSKKFLLDDTHGSRGLGRWGRPGLLRLHAVDNQASFFYYFFLDLIHLLQPNV